MSEERDVAQLHERDTFFATLRALLLADGSRLHTNVVLYTQFGIVRGRIARNVVEQLKLTDTLEIDECEVEHFSSHMPTGHFAKLYVRATQIQGFVVS